MSRRPAALTVVVILIGLGLNGLAAIAAPASPAWRMDTPWTTERALVRVEQDTIVAEIADTIPLRSRGLGYRDELVPGTGMLFIYGEPALQSFWMKGMRFCIDIVWIESGRIVGAAELVCPEPGVNDGDLMRYRSPSPVRYVLEVNAGWLRSRGYGLGSPVEISFRE